MVTNVTAKAINNNCKRWLDRACSTVITSPGVREILTFGVKGHSVQWTAEEGQCKTCSVLTLGGLPPPTRLGAEDVVENLWD